MIHQLSVRSTSSASALPVVGPRAARDAFLAPGRARVVLVHGFANSQKKASGAYAGMVRSLDGLLAPRRVDDLASVWEFHWPGNHPMPGLAGTVLNLLTYNARPGEANASGEALGHLLADLPSTEKVVVVGHSMGCRVVLHAILTMQLDQLDRGHGGPDVTTILMAAAVPASECAPAAAPLASADDLASQPWYGFARSRTTYTVLYSGRDQVLRAAFPAGQFMHGFLARAVGLEGAPDAGSRQTRRWTSTHPTGLGHSGYWKSQYAASFVGEKIHPACSRALPRWLDGLDSSPLPERTLGERSLASHRMAMRA